MKWRSLRFLPLLIALVTLAGLTWLAASMLLFDEPDGEVARPSGLEGRLESFSTYPRMARAFELIQQGRLDEAADWLQSASREDPTGIPPLVQLAELRLQQDRPADARAAAARAADLRPADPQLQWLLARAEAADGDYAAALSSVDRALGQGMWTTGLKNPERQRAEAARIGYLLELGRAAQAAEALSVLPEPTADDLLRLGDLFYGKGDLAQAAAAFRRARQVAEAAPSSAAPPPAAGQAADDGGEDWIKASRRLAETEIKTGDDAAAMQTLQALVERRPGDAQALHQLANLAEQAGRPGRAADWLARAIAVESTSAGRNANDDTALRQDRQRLARLYLQADEPAAAARVLAAIPGQALDAEGETLKAQILLQLDRPGEAAAIFQKQAGEETGTERVAALRSAVEALRRAGEVDRELDLRRQLVRLTGSEADRQALLERLIAVGRMDEAAKILTAEVEAGDSGAMDRLLSVLVAADRAEAGIEMLERQGRLVEAAELAASTNRWAQASDLLRRAYRRAGGRDAELLARAVYAAGKAGGRQARIRVLQAVFPYPGLPAPRRRAFGLQLVQDLHDAGRRQQAEQVLQELATATGDPGLAVEVATELAGRGNCAAALDWARRAAAGSSPPPRLFALAGFCAERLGRAAQARRDLQQAIAMTDAAGGLPDPAWLDTLGYLESAAGRTEQAVALWQRSLAQRFDPVVALSTATALRNLGEAAAADSLLARIEPQDLPTDERARYFAEMAEAAAGAGDPTTARALLRQALALQPTADRWFRLGALLAEAGETEEALAAYGKAADLAPDNADIQAAMGYALVRLGRDAAAEDHFARAIALHPDGLGPVYEDSGYVNKRLARNDIAVSRFKVAIDRIHGQGAEAEETRFRLRREVERLENRWTATANVTVNTLQAAAGAPSPVRDTSNGTGAVELAWQPPVIGNRDSRTVEVFSRIFWNAEERSIVPVQNSLQAGVGARWKPLTDYNLVLSFERLFAIGRFAYDDWLARASISFGQNLDWQPVREDWPTGSLYLDAAQVLGEGATFLTAIGQYGYAWKQPFGIDLPAEADAVAAYGLATGSSSRDDTVSSNRVEIGAGLGYRLWFNDTKYEAYRSTAEVGLETRYRFQNDAQDDLVLQVRAQLRF